MKLPARSEYQDAIRAEQVRQLYAGKPASLGASGLLALLLTYVQFPYVHQSSALLWLLLIETVVLLRVVLYLQWRRSTLSPLASAAVWLGRFRFGAFAAGCCWGMSSLLLFPPNDLPHQATLSFALAGVTAGAIASYGVDRISTGLYVAPLMLPLMWRLFEENDRTGITMAIMTMLFLVFILASARRQQRNLQENIALRGQAEHGKTMLQQRDTDLRLLTERLTALIEAIPDVIIFKDGKGRWLITNEPAKRVFRLHGLKWRGRTDLELAEMRPDLRRTHESCHVDDEAAWGSGKLTLFQERFADENDRLCDFEVRKMPLFGHDGHRRALVVIGRDVTERRAAEEELQIAAAAFDVQEGIVIADAEQRILRVNRAFTRLTGYAPEEVVGNTAAMMRSDRHDELFYQQRRQKLAEEGYWQGEVWHRCKDGRDHPHWLTISSIRNVEGSITHYIGTFSDISLYKEAEAEIHTLAYFDHLTNLPNRRLLLDRLKQALTASVRSKRHGAVLFIDLDNFKTLNDTRGHDIGDLLLIEVAQRLTGAVRAEDTVARLGGDEFVVMLEGLSHEPGQAATYADMVGAKILEALGQPYVLQGYEHHSTPSIGVSLFLGEQESVDDLLKHADAAMYQAKQSGRNTIRFFDPAMQSALEARIRLEQDLRQALPQQQLLLNYQIQVDDTRTIVGAEVLLRWEHPACGMISPAQFIPVAEECGLIVPIGLWVMQMACSQLKQWESHPFARTLQLAVNVSARQFRQGDFVDQVRHVLQQTGARPEMLKLELTESLVLENVADTVEKMQALKKIGVRFSMDDFGTGQSSLAQLKRLPLDQVKIDQSFVRDIAVDANDAAIVQTIIAMTGTLGLDVIAEGVETEVQLEFLRRNGCREFQGYLFGRPVSVSELEMLFPTS